MSKDERTKDTYGWCKSCGALVFGSSKCHKCGGEVKIFCVDMELFKLKEQNKELEVENKQLLELSENLDEHPEEYDGPCLCKLCKSYG